MKSEQRVTALEETRQRTGALVILGLYPDGISFAWATEVEAAPALLHEQLVAANNKITEYLREKNR